MSGPSRVPLSAMTVPVVGKKDATPPVTKTRVPPLAVLPVRFRTASTRKAED